MPDTAAPQPAPADASPATAEVAVGILSYNSVETVRGAISSAQAALDTSFAGRSSILINADGGSKDGTLELAVEAAGQNPNRNFLQLTYPVYPVQKLTPEYYGVPGKANALQAVFNAALERGATACAILDSNVSSLTPEWAETLLRPVVEDAFDFVSPCYLRHKYEGTMIGGIVYPLTRALYGKRLQQPNGGEFALSSKLLQHLVRQPQFDGDTNSIVDVWITIQAVSGGFRVAQAFLGPRILNRSEPVPEVSGMLAQVLGSVFAEMERTASIWQRVRGSQPLPAFGSQGEPSPKSVDTSPMIQSFRLGYKNLQDIWRLVLPPGALVTLKRMSLQNAEAIEFDDSLWARVVYDFALAWRMRVMDRDHLLRALTPLYLGWVAAYVQSVREAGPAEAQERIETLCLAYEAQKSYLISRWRWPDRFNP